MAEVMDAMEVADDERSQSADQSVDRSSDPIVVDESALREDPFGPPPIQPDQEWANALTHGIATLAAIGMGIYLVSEALQRGPGMAIACTAYMIGVTGTFLCSTLSHVVLRQPLLNTLRAWDQAMIYTMIAGTYTPLAYTFATDSMRAPLLAGIWIAALAGFLGKVAFRHRINSIGTISYLLLGWLPAIPLAGLVPASVVYSMLAGGILYTVGVVFLINDQKVRYLHAGWHLFVMTAAAVQYWGILAYVVRAS